ncbi:MAG: 30S ribosomal protein S13 [Candidatus Woesearchaeota archaeon]
MEQKDTKQDYRHIVRIANTDLDGKEQVMYGLTKIKGVGIMFANAVCTAAQVDKMKKCGVLSDAEVKKLDEIVRNPHGLPEWLYNRRKDPEAGDDKHLVSTDVSFVQDSDIKRMRMIKCYRGVRHSAGLPVRGQRTKSNFRKNKRAAKGGSLGVKKRAGARAGRV